MAIFEKRTANKVLIDDTESLSCVIENWFNTNGHTEFVIRVQRGPFSDKTWRVQKRYNDFVKLHSALQTSGIHLPLPPKKIVGNMDPKFIAERQQALQKYLNIIVMNPILVSSLPARSFIDPANYCQPFREIALQHVSLALRGEVGWEVVSPLTEIGWRLRKHYYHVRCKNIQSKEELWAGWIDYGPDKHLDDKDMHAIFKSISQIQHPYIYPIEMCLCTDVGALVIRTSHKNGSLRDVLYGVKPKQSFMKKYGNPKGHKPLEISQIALYGRQILEALKFLNEKGLPYGHLHTGNIIIDNDRVKLLDIENGIIGVPSFYRPYFMQHKKIHSLQAIDVYCFGHTLYEMTFGSPLHESVVEHLPGECNPILRSVLESILSPEACKSGIPTIDDLLKHAFFANIKPTMMLSSDKIHLKIPTSTKEQIKKIIIMVEDRLKDEQKMVRSQKRLVKVQEMMSSEEEKKKQRSKMKQEHKLAKEKMRQKTIEENEKVNGASGSGSDRAESVNSTSTNTSIGTSTPPSVSGVTSASAPLPPPPPPPPNGISTLPVVTTNGNSQPDDRSALLTSICGFNKSSLRKTKVK
ncbi:PX domain-containing protein kinase-like protein [Onthophagus taurus]|uniref:PX domain-containing protein kinase-like protein n=1 Tax=Onthophagus taurus TaxID=166361 RepID=UPI0039BE2D6C